LVSVTILFGTTKEEIEDIIYKYIFFNEKFFLKQNVKKKTIKK
jgi:hypothetical protein